MDDNELLEIAEDIRRSMFSDYLEHLCLNEVYVAAEVVREIKRRNFGAKDESV